MELRDYVRLTERLNRGGESIEVPLAHLAGVEEQVIYGLVAGGLASIQQSHLESTAQLVLTELLNNAEVAILRADSLERGSGSDAAAAGPDELRELSGGQRAALRREIKARNKKPGIVFRAKLSGDKLHLSVSNRGTPGADDVQRIERGLAIGARQSGLEGLSERPDLISAGGRGLGLIVAVMALRAAGLPEDSLSFSSDAEWTVFSLAVPVNLPASQKLSVIESALLAEVQNLPSPPAHFDRIMAMCRSPDSSIRQTVAEIERDQTIAGQLIRLANSAGVGAGRVAGLEEAVKLVGLKNIADFLLQIGSTRILLQRYGESPDLTEHPMRVAFFARRLARGHGLQRLADQAYVAGLLHDIGKVVLLSAIRGKRDLERVAESRDFRERVRLEELACGASHAHVGGMLAEKWNFPEVLRLAIEYHHTPLRATAIRKTSRENFDVIMIVYMANAIANCLDGRTSFFAIAPIALEYFNLTTENAFQMTAAALNGEFQDLHEE